MMDGALRVREGTVDDAGVVVRHRRLMFEEMGYRDPSRNDEMDFRVLTYLKEAIPSGGYRAWMVVDEGGNTVAGSGLTVVRLPGKPLNPSGAYAYLQSLYVEPPFRRQGIGGQLMQTMVEWARREGITELRLHASAEGRSIYERLGFSQTNEMRLLLT